LVLAAWQFGAIEGTSFPLDNTLAFVERRHLIGAMMAAIALVVVTAAAALLYLIAVVVRQPLVEGDGPWFITMGWVILILLTALSFVISMVWSPASDEAIWVTGPAVFVPFWVRRLEESYREGVDEARGTK